MSNEDQNNLRDGVISMAYAVVNVMAIECPECAVSIGDHTETCSLKDIHRAAKALVALTQEE